jgi:hypothetical protein
LVDIDEQSMADLQMLLCDLGTAGQLKRINFARSNASGRLFYKGREFPVANPVLEHVTVESMGPDGRPMVRDDDPPRDFQSADGTFHYVKTVYVDANGSVADGGGATGTGVMPAVIAPIGSQRFIRYYVLLNWLQSVTDVDMSGTALSGYGLTSLVAATAHSLESLRVASCSLVDNHGMYAIATLCTQLKFLDISSCPKLTKYGSISHFLFILSRAV